MREVEGRVKMDALHRLTIRVEDLYWAVLKIPVLVSLAKLAAPLACQYAPNGIKPHLAHACPMALQHLERIGYVKLMTRTGLALVILTLLIFAYRLSPYHPLAQFPGPVSARVNKTWMLRRILAKDTRVAYRELHRKYGDIVRVGPDELSVCNVNAVQDLYSFKATLLKGDWYQGITPIGHSSDFASILELRDRNSHQKRRRVWDKAFTNSALAQFRPAFHDLYHQLVARLDERAQGKSNVPFSQWISFFQIDLLGQMAFSSPYDMLKDGGDRNGVLAELPDALLFLMCFGHMQYLRPFLWPLPKSITIPKVRHSATRLVEWRSKNPSHTKDIYSHLLDEENDGDTQKVKLSTDDLTGEATLAIIAGGGTTSLALILAIYLLVTSGRYKDLQHEIDQAFPDLSPEADLDIETLARLPFLNATIQETLRLQPPVSSGMQRTAGPEGATVMGHYLPEGTSVSCPQYSLQRDPRYFSDPDTFRPERWTKPEKELVHENRAYFPFLSGPFACVGKRFAFEELQFVLASLVRRYDMSLPPTFEATAWETTIHDIFTLDVSQPLDVTLRIRQFAV